MEFHKAQIESAGYQTAIELVKAFDSLDDNKNLQKNTSVLVFLPGIFEIEEMHRLMENVMVSE